MTLLQVLRNQSHDVKAGHEKDCSLHETGRWLSADCFYASHSIFPGIGQSVLCLCCGPESAFFAPQQRKSHTLRLTSAHFLSINAARENTKTGLCFAFITILYGGYIDKCNFGFKNYLDLSHRFITRPEWPCLLEGGDTETFLLVKRPMGYKIRSSPARYLTSANIPAPNLWRHAADAWQP